MGTTAEYVMVSKEEIKELLTSIAPTLPDDLYDERYGGSRFEPPQDTFQKDVAANPLLLLDHAKVRGHIEQLFEQAKEQQALSQQRLLLGDNEEQFDEMCKLYAWGDRYWSRSDAAFGGLSEDEVAREAVKRGYHLRFDLDKRWDMLHELLTGITLRESWDLATLTNAQPWIEKAKQNENFPSGCVKDIEEARNAVCAMEKEMSRAYAEFERALQDRTPEFDNDDEGLQDDRADETDDEDDDDSGAQSQILNALRTPTWRAKASLYRNLMQIATMQKQIEEGGLEAFEAARKKREATYNAAQSLFGAAGVIGPVYMSGDEFISGLADSAKTARLLESMINDAASNLRKRKLCDTDLHNATRITEEAIRLEKLISVPGWLNHFSSEPASNTPNDSPSSDELLSMSVSGGKNCPGKNTHEATYLTVEQTKAIADLLEPLTSEELALKHNIGDPYSGDFDQFKKFYVRAAQFEAGVVVFLS